MTPLIFRFFLHSHVQTKAGGPRYAGRLRTRLDLPGLPVSIGLGATASLPIPAFVRHVLDGRPRLAIIAGLHPKQR